MLKLSEIVFPFHRSQIKVYCHRRRVHAWLHGTDCGYEHISIWIVQMNKLNWNYSKHFYVYQVAIRVLHWVRLSCVLNSKRLKKRLEKFTGWTVRNATWKKSSFQSDLLTSRMELRCQKSRNVLWNFFCFAKKAFIWSRSSSHYATISQRRSKFSTNSCWRISEMSSIYGKYSAMDSTWIWPTGTQITFYFFMEDCQFNLNHFRFDFFCFFLVPTAKSQVYRLTRRINWFWNNKCQRQSRWFHER